MKHARPDYQKNFNQILANIPEEEPVFFLRGQDKAAPAALEAWANENEKLNGDPQLTKLTRDHAQAMRQYQTTTKAKVADIGKGVTSNK
jgi:hypothetical protein